MRAEFDITGRIGKIKEFDGATRINIGTNYRVKDGKGNWVDDPHWNEVVIFSEHTRKYVAKYIGVGDKITVRGRIRNSSYEKDGETHYTTELRVFDLNLMAKKREDSADDNQPQE